MKIEEILSNPLLKKERFLINIAGEKRTMKALIEISKFTWPDVELCLQNNGDIFILNTPSEESKKAVLNYIKGSGIRTYLRAY